LILSTIQKDDNQLNIKELCELAGIARSTYYRYIQQKDIPSQKEQQDALDFQSILTAYRFRGYDKGVWGIYMRLLHMGIRMNHKKIRRLMRKYGLFCPIRKANPYRQMAKALRTNAVADNRVNREFKAHGPRKILLTDITYIPIEDGFTYLSVIIDAFTMQALAYQLSDSLEIDFVLLTLNQLIEKHGDTLTDETLIHSDQGFHYTSIAFREFIKNTNLIQSMSRRGNCWDNAPQESFFGHMKDELSIKAQKWKSMEDVKPCIDDWMDYYNNDRYQMGLKKMSPNEYYKYITEGIYPTFLK
jgi:transposase InsO family protein